MKWRSWRWLLSSWPVEWVELAHLEHCRQDVDYSIGGREVAEKEWGQGVRGGGLEGREEGREKWGQERRELREREEECGQGRGGWGGTKDMGERKGGRYQGYHPTHTLLCNYTLHAGSITLRSLTGRLHSVLSHPKVRQYLRVIILANASFHPLILCSLHPLLILKW